MLSNIRNFAKTKMAGILVGIIIIPFVFWGMGSVFSGGNSNNIAKINNLSISTQDFMDHLNSSNIEVETIKENIDNNIIEEILSELISKKMISLEISNLNLTVSDKILNKKIKENKNFKDENNKFSRSKYEKFLLSSNLAAPDFEAMLKENELRKNLFSYISGGIISPHFLINDTFKDQTKKINLNYIKLNNIYKKKENFSESEIRTFVGENENELKEKIIDFKYAIITPKNLTGNEEFNNLFFEKIDDIENEILNESSFDDLVKKYQLEIKTYDNFKFDDSTNEKNYYKHIYEDEEINKAKIIDENDYYVLYAINEIVKKIPSFNNKKFENKIRNILFDKTKFDFNNNILNRIDENKFSQRDFDEIVEKNFLQINTIKISSIKDNSKFTSDGIKYLYKLSLNDFGLIGDENQNIFLFKITKLVVNNISENSEDYSTYKNQTNVKIRDSMYDSYDNYLNIRYKVNVNQKTLERVKNYFR